MIRRHALRTVVSSLIAVSLAALVAAGCGGSGGAGDDGDGGDAERAPKVVLGMDEDVACIVYGEDVESDDVRDLADQVRDAFEQARPDAEVDEVELDRYRGDLDAFEALALDQLVEVVIVERAADGLDVEADDDAATDTFSEMVDGTELDVDDVFDAIEDGTGLDKDTVELAATQTKLLEDSFDELESDDAEAFDDADEWLEDELRPAASEDVECGEGIEWNEGLRDDLELADGERVAFSDLLAQLVTNAVEDAAKPDPVSLGIDYEDAVVPVLRDFTPLIERLVSVSNKLSSGSIDLNRVAEGLSRQVTDMRALRARAARVRSEDAYLQRNHQQLVRAIDAYVDSLVALRALVKSTSQSQLASREKAYNAAVARADKALTAWGAGLDDDPEQRTFARSVLELQQMTAAAEAAK